MPWLGGRDLMRNSLNDDMRLVGRQVMVSGVGCSVAGTLHSSGNHGVVLEVNGKMRTFSGFASVRPLASTSGADDSVV